MEEAGKKIAEGATTMAGEVRTGFERAGSLLKRDKSNNQQPLGRSSAHYDHIATTSPEELEKIEEQKKLQAIADTIQAAAKEIQATAKQVKKTARQVKEAEEKIVRGLKAAEEEANAVVPFTKEVGEELAKRRKAAEEAEKMAGIAETAINAVLEKVKKAEEKAQKAVQTAAQVIQEAGTETNEVKETEEQRKAARKLQKEAKQAERLEKVQKAEREANAAVSEADETKTVTIEAMVETAKKTAMAQEAKTAAEQAGKAVEEAKDIAMELKNAADAVETTTNTAATPKTNTPAAQEEAKKIKDAAIAAAKELAGRAENAIKTARAAANRAAEQAGVAAEAKTVPDAIAAANAANAANKETWEANRIKYDYYRRNIIVCISKKKQLLFYMPDISCSILFLMAQIYQNRSNLKPLNNTNFSSLQRLCEALHIPTKKVTLKNIMQRIKVLGVTNNDLLYHLNDSSSEVSRLNTVIRNDRNVFENAGFNDVELDLEKPLDFLDAVATSANAIFPPEKPGRIASFCSWLARICCCCCRKDTGALEDVNIGALSPPRREHGGTPLLTGGTASGQSDADYSHPEEKTAPFSFVSN